jgi:hypothetical protein
MDREIAQTLAETRRQFEVTKFRKLQEQASWLINWMIDLFIN